jgi:hypothetical protein
LPDILHEFVTTKGMEPPRRAGKGAVDSKSASHKQLLAEKQNNRYNWSKL